MNNTKEILTRLNDEYGFSLLNKQYNVTILLDGEYYDNIYVNVFENDSRKKCKNEAIKTCMRYGDGDYSFMDYAKKIRVSREANKNHFRFKANGFELEKDIIDRVENKYPSISLNTFEIKRFPQVFYDDLHNGCEDNLLYLCYYGITYGFLCAYIDPKKLKTRFYKEKDA